MLFGIRGWLLIPCGVSRCATVIAVVVAVAVGAIPATWDCSTASVESGETSPPSRTSRASRHGSRHVVAAAGSMVVSRTATALLR